MKFPQFHIAVPPKNHYTRPNFRGGSRIFWSNTFWPLH